MSNVRGKFCEALELHMYSLCRRKEDLRQRPIV